jgi:hypothetical protein
MRISLARTLAGKLRPVTTPVVTILAKKAAGRSGLVKAMIPPGRVEVVHVGKDRDAKA